MQPIFAILCLVATPAADWPGFRGDGSSRSTAENLPLQWSDESHLAWQQPLTGYGQSSPVVWGDAVFVTGVQGDKKEQLVVDCFELKTGRPRWQRTYAAGRQEEASDYVSKGAPTPLVDAERLYLFFESGDFFALDHAGKDIWRRNLADEYGDFIGNHGVGSSPAGSPDLLLVLVDHDGPSYLLAVDKQTGKNRWKVDRPANVSWSSPIVALDGAAGDGATGEVIVSSNGSVESFQLADGKRRWWLSGLKGNTVPSATVAPTCVIVGSSEPGANLAIARDSTGEVPAERVLWRSKEATATFSSPLVHDESVYFVNRAGVGFCLDLKSGETVWSERLGGSCWASPIGARDRVYFFGKDGATTVVRAGKKFEKLAENRLTIEGRVYGVAAVPGAFVLRTGQKLICVGNP